LVTPKIASNSKTNPEAMPSELYNEKPVYLWSKRETYQWLTRYALLETTEIGELRNFMINGKMLLAFIDGEFKSFKIHPIQWQAHAPAITTESIRKKVIKAMKKR